MGRRNKKKARTPKARTPKANTLAYTFALRPDPQQRKYLLKAIEHDRRLWNYMVRKGEDGKGLVRDGRRDAVAKTIVQADQGKKIIGRRTQEIADKKAVTLERQQWQKMNLEGPEKEEVKWTPQPPRGGVVAQRFGLASGALLLQGQRAEGVKVPNSAHQTLRRLGNSWSQHWRPENPLGAPRKSKNPRHHSVSFQVQPAHQSVGKMLIPFAGRKGKDCDYLVWLGPLLDGLPAKAQWVRVISHRAIPQGSVIKNVVLGRSGDALWVCLQFSTTDVAYYKSFEACPGKVIGLDPGIKMPFTGAFADTPRPGQDGFDISFTTSRTVYLDRKIERLQRKLERQKFALKEGARPKVWSSGMRKTQHQLDKARAERQNIVVEQQRLTARELLSQADTIGIGHWSEPTPQQRAAKKKKRKGSKAVRAKGVAARERTINKKMRSQSPRRFVSTLSEYAARSRSPKFVDPKVDEKWSTQTCAVCGEHTGPKGIGGLNTRSWICSNCHVEMNRDRCAANNIAKITISNFALLQQGKTTGAQPVAAASVSIPLPRKRGGKGAAGGILDARENPSGERDPATTRKSVTTRLSGVYPMRGQAVRSTGSLGTTGTRKGKSGGLTVNPLRGCSRSGRGAVGPL